MGSRSLPLCSIILMMVMSTAPTIVSGGSVSNLSVSIYDESPEMDVDAFVMVQGTFHTILFDVGQGNTILVVLYEGGAPPSTRNVSNYYEFEYTASGGFKDKSYGSYIDPVRSSRDVGKVTFCVAMDPSVSIAKWTLRIDVDGNPETTKSISMRKMTVGLTLSQPEFVFRIDPFIAKNSTSDQSFRTVNGGNVPVTYSMRLDRLVNEIKISSLDGTVHRAETRLHSVTVAIPKHSPEKIEVKGILRADVPKSILKLTGSVALQTSIEQIVNIRVIIAHPGYEVINLGDGKVIIQYETSKNMKYGDVLTLRTYYAGRASVTLSYQAIDLKAKDTRLNGSATEPPLTCQLSEVSEVSVDIVVTATRDQVSAKLKYHIESSDGTIRYDFETGVLVGSSSTPQSGMPIPGISWMGLAFVVGIVAFIVAFIIFSKLRAKKGPKVSRRPKKKQSRADEDERQKKDKKEPRKEKGKRKIDPKRRKKLEHRRKRWLEKHEKKVRRKALRR